MLSAPVFCVFEIFLVHAVLLTCLLVATGEFASGKCLTTYLQKDLEVMSLQILLAGPPSELLFHTSQTFPVEYACETINECTCYHVF